MVVRTLAFTLASIRLLLSPSDVELEDNELGAVAGQIEPATRSNARKALLEWQEACRGQPDDMAVLYLSGHGAQQSQTDPFVLLEDFAADRRVMDYSIDVGRVHRGMAGSNMPQTQFFFIDACRIRPGAFSQYRTAGSGLGLNEEWEGEDTRAAPIYFSAATGTAALGEPGASTLFAQALVQCLEGSGVDDFADAQGRFRVTTNSLATALQQRVAELAGEHGETQHVVVAGQMRDAILHYFDPPPKLPVAIELQPEEARRVAWADLWDSNREVSILKGSGFESNPMTWTVPVGMYSLDVNIRPDTPPLRSKVGFPVPVAPRVVGPRVVRLA